MSGSDAIDRLRAAFKAGGHLSATTTRKGKIIGFGESEGRGRAASGDADDSGKVSITLSGTSPRGEEGTIQACQRFVAHLNSLGDLWEQPSEVSGVPHIDAVAQRKADLADETLTIQVVRALTDPGFWQAMGHTGNVTLSLSLDESADILKRAVEFKSAKIPQDVRTQLTLVLDACDLPGLALDPVIDQFNISHAGWIQSQGFRSVWVVGPWKEMVRQLGGPKA